MPLSGLPNPVPGLALWASAASVPVLATGLVLLRITRPSETLRIIALGGKLLGSPSSSIHNGANELLRVCIFRLGGMFGALLVLLGLVLSSMAMIVGSANDAEQRASSVIPLALLPVLWASERFFLQNCPLPPLQNVAGVIVLMASVFITWGAPQPQDSMTMGLEGEIGGCDGGTRLIFALYMAIWITAAIFGTLLFIPSDELPPEERVTGAQSIISLSEDEVAEPAKPSMLRKKLLPALYGLCINVAGILFATGVASDRMGCVALGAALLCIAVLCAWDWMWRMELTLGSWAPASQLFTSLFAWLQAQCIFRDYRYAPVMDSGLFVVHQSPGIWIMVAGFVLSFFMVTMFLEADDSTEWGASGPITDHKSLPYTKTRQLIPANEGNRFARCIAVVLFPFCVTALLLGISRPVYIAGVKEPALIMVPTTAGSTTTTTTTTAAEHAAVGKTYLELIPMSYNNRMPISALAMMWGSFVQPTMQFTQIMILLFRPLIVPKHFKTWARAAVINGANGRFVTPMVVMLLVSFANMSSPDGEMLTVKFGPGFWWLIVHGFISVALALALEVDADLIESIERKALEDEERSLGGNMFVGEDRSGSDDEDTGDDEDGLCDGEGNKLWIGTFFTFVFLGVVGTTMYIGFTNPFLVFEFRLDGLIMSTMAPTILDFWKSLEEASDFMGKWAASTVLFAFCGWVPMLLMSLRCSHSRWARISEKAARQWVMGHHWAVAILLLYYIFTQRNRGIFEVCVHFPRPAIGPVAVAAMGGAVIGLQAVGKWLITKPSLAREAPAPRSGLAAAIRKLGIPIWMWGAAAGGCFLFFLLWLYNHGMENPARLETLDDVNDRLARAMPMINDVLSTKIPESIGDCDALWEHRVQANQTGSSNPGSMKHQNCKGHKPVAQQSGGSVDLKVRWITGLNSLRLSQIVVLPPSDRTSPEGRWHVAIDASFRDLHVWLEVELNSELTGKEVWLDDNLCCNRPYHFRLEASAVCTHEEGFHRLHVDIPKLDNIELTHTVRDGDKNWYQMDYGSYDFVETTLKNLFRKETRKVQLKEADGTVIDPMLKLSDIVEQVVMLNTGHVCPQDYNEGNDDSLDQAAVRRQ